MVKKIELEIKNCNECPYIIPEDDGSGYYCRKYDIFMKRAENIHKGCKLVNAIKEITLVYIKLTVGTTYRIDRCEIPSAKDDDNLYKVKNIGMEIVDGAEAFILSVE